MCACIHVARQFKVGDKLRESGRAGVGDGLSEGENVQNAQDRFLDILEHNSKLFMRSQVFMIFHDFL